MAQEEVKIFFKVEGLDGYITDLDELQDALKGVTEDTKKAAEASEDIGKSGGKAKSFFSAVKGKGVGAFKALKGAIAATGIGLLITAFAQLVQWFKESDAGAKILQGTTAALGAIFSQLQILFFDLVDLIKPLFEDPVQSIKDFGQAIVDNLINRFMGILELIPNLAKAIGKLFEGKFSEAGTIAANAVGKVLLGVEDTVAAVTTAIDVVQDFGEKAVEVYNKAAAAVVAAVTASNNLIDAQSKLRQLQQDLLVENAELNQELETQQKIADDTTRSYDERKAALDRVNAANEKLAANAVELAKQERDTLALALELATTDEQRREIKDSLAEAEAALIDTETAAQIVRLESAQLNRELDQEEVKRKQTIKDILEGFRLDEIENEQQAYLEGLRIAEERTLAELDVLNATEEQKQAVRDAFAKKREDAAKTEAEKLKEIEEDVKDAKLQIVKQGLNAIAALAEAFASEDEEKAKKNFNIQKALSLASATLAGVEGTINAFKTAQDSPITKAFPPYPFIQAGLAGAFAVAQVATIAKSQFKSPGNIQPPPPPSTANPGAVNNFGGGNGGNIDLGEQDANITSIGQQTPIRAYVVATEVTDAQEANFNIENLATL